MRLALAALMAVPVISACPKSDGPKSDGSVNPAGDQLVRVAVGVDETIAATGLHEYLRAAFEVSSSERLDMKVGSSLSVAGMARSGAVDFVLLAGDEAFQMVNEAGVAESEKILGHEELVFVGPSEDKVRAHGVKTTAEFLKNLGQINALYLKPKAGSTEALVHTRLMSEIQDREPGSFVESGLSGVDFVKKLSTGRGYGLVRRSSILQAYREGVKPARVYQDGRPELVLRLRAIEVRPSRTGRPKRKALADFLYSDKVASMVGTYGRANFGLPIYGAGDVKEGEGAVAPGASPPKK